MVLAACGPHVEPPPSSAVRPVNPPLVTPVATTTAVAPTSAPDAPGITPAAPPPRSLPAGGGVSGLRPMNDGDRLYHQFCLNHDDSAGCSDFRDDALRRRGIDPSSATPDFPPRPSPP